MINNTAIQEKLNALKIPGIVTNTSENGFYNNYYVSFAPSVTLAKIKARKDDLSLLFGSPVEIDTECGQVVLKAQKASRANVGIYDYTKDLAQGIDGYEIPVIIGESETGKRIFSDLTKCPHILAGGATGSGKSVFINNCILSTLYSGKCHLVLIDVKRVEFSIYEGLPHLIAPIVYDAKTALNTLKNLCYEMDKRYQTLKNSKCRNIQDYRTRGGKMNYICVVIDELADLVLCNKKIESYLIRLAQLGRASGIHLILATQRPDATIISGLIRANIPTRVCFAVQKATDSRIILDMTGGERLRGAGDGLYIPIGSKVPTRFQSPFITTDTLIQAIEKAKQV